MILNNFMSLKFLQNGTINRTWTKIVYRNLFASSYLDSQTFRIQRKRMRYNKLITSTSKMEIIKKYKSKGVKGLFTEDLQLLIHCTELQDDEDSMSFLIQVLIEDLKENFRKIESTRMLMNLYFWLCYIRKDSENAKKIFDQVYNHIDSYHTKNRYFSTMFEAERYHDILDGYKKLKSPSRDDQLMCMGALYKVGDIEAFAEAQFLYNSHPKERAASIFALFSIEQNEIGEAVKILNLRHCLQNNIVPKTRIQQNLQLFCLLKNGQSQLAMNTLNKWNDFSYVSKRNLSISSEIFKMLENSSEISDETKLKNLCDTLQHRKFITLETVQQIVFEPIEWNDRKGKKVL